jgi:hypothetical protein
MLHLILLSPIFLGAFAGAQTFKVRVLEALSGKPRSDMPISFFCEGRYKETMMDVVTDRDGFVAVPYGCKSGRIKIDVSIDKNGKVEGCGDLGPQSIEQIMEVGVISDPTAAGGIWCPARVSKKLKQVPGQVIVFVKKPTWWQKYAAP